MTWLRQLLRKIRRWFFYRRIGSNNMANNSRGTAKSAATKSRAPASKSRATSSSGRGRYRWLKILLLLGTGGFLLGVLGLVGIFFYYGLDPDLPRIDRMGDYQPKVVSRVLDREGELLGEIYEERRTVVPREKIPPVMVHAIVDAEDAQFYEHTGLNYYGMMRAFIYNLRPGAHLQGASTITQQLVKNFLLKTNERTLKRKVQEMILARRIETALSKDDILALYLNQIEFGHSRFGIEEASRFYFGKSISDVNAGEAAVLASLPKGPAEMDPWKRPDRLKDRQRYVLSQMLRYNHISKADAEFYAQKPIEVVKAPPSVGAAPEFVDEVKRLLIEKFGEKKLPFLGVTVQTTCDARLQKLARESLESRLEQLDERQGYRKAQGRVKDTATAAIKKYLDGRALNRLEKRADNPTAKDRTDTLNARWKALSRGKVTEAVVVEVRAGSDKSDKGAAKPAGVLVDTGAERGFLPLPAQKDRYNPKGVAVTERFKPGDVLFVRAEPTLGRTPDNLPILVPEFGPQASAVVIDPATREVRAMVGGYGFRAGGYNRALRARRQPGSAFKPFLYAAAFNSGKYTPATVLNDAPQVYEQPGLAPWKPKNAESHEFLGPVRLRTALAKSLNTVAAQLVAAVGPDALARIAHEAGIESKLDRAEGETVDGETHYNLSLGIGSEAVKLVELTNAYATFASGGVRAPAVMVKKIGDEELPRAQPVQAISPEVSYLVTSIMESVIDEGTAASAKSKLRRPAAGKTGTTNSERDAWFIGYTPDLVAGAWVGFDDMRDLGRGEQGARSALPIWTDIVVGALKGMPARGFAQPPGIVIARIDPNSGLLAQPGAVGAVDEKFLNGTAPTEMAPLAGETNPDTFIMDQQQ